MLYYYNATPQLGRVEARLQLALFEAKGRKLRRRRELAKHPDTAGPSPEALEADTLREAIQNALFSLRLLHE